MTRATPPHPRDADCARAMPRSVPPKTEGAGKAGCTCAPAASCAKQKAHELITTGSPKQSGFPCAVVLTVSFVLAPETGLVVSVGDNASCVAPDISVGISGPHDFAVRSPPLRPFAADRVHRIPRPTSVTIAIRPSCGRGTGRGHKDDLPDGRSEIFLRKGLDRDFAKRPDGQISPRPTRAKTRAAPARAARPRAQVRPSPQAPSHHRSRPQARSTLPPPAPARSAPPECPT